MSDRGLLYAAAFLRTCATGLVGVLLGLYLAELQFNPIQIGIVVSAGLSGAALATFLVTLGGDRVGRRRVLLLVAIVGSVGATTVAVGSVPIVITVAAFVGMLNGMGRDRGASSVIEQAILPAIVADDQRTRVFAWYNVVQDIGHALGGLLAALPWILQSIGGVQEPTSMRIVFGIYPVLILCTVPLYHRLSAEVESGARGRLQISQASRRTLVRISSLFALDSLGGGFLTTALLAFFFYERFGAGPGVIGLLFFGARVANALSHLGAAWLAKRIGLLNTMVFTHIPSSLLLVTVPFAPNFGIAALLFLLREGLVEMDVPTRQSYVMAVVRPHERTVAAGVTHLVRMGGWAVAPSVAGLLMAGASLGTPLIVGAAMKISYDILLYMAFRDLKPPEEQAASGKPIG